MEKYRLLNEDGSWVETSSFSEAKSHGNYIEVSDDVPIVIVPQVISALRFWLAVYIELNMTEDEIIDSVNQIEDISLRTRILIALKKAQEFERDNSLLNLMTKEFNISDEKLDKIFITGEKIEI